MAATDRQPRTPAELRREIAGERALLVESVETLREEVGRLRAKLPLVAAGALGIGFVAAGGLRAAARLARRRLRG